MIKQIFIIFPVIFLFAACASSTRFPTRHSTEEDTGTSRENRNENNEGNVNNSGGVLESRVGVASFYSDKYQGKKTSSGEVFDQDKLTAAHPTYSMGTIVRVKNLQNRKSVVVTINDRMTDLNGRIIDLSKKAAEEIGMLKQGIAKVQVDVLKWGN